MSKEIIILGTGGHATSVANVALSAGFNIKAFATPKITNSRYLDYPVIDENDIFKMKNSTALALGIGDNHLRVQIFNKFQDKLTSFSLDNIYFPTLIHASASIGFQTTINAGTVVMPNATIGPCSRIGNACIINTNASIDHDSVMEDFSSLAPGVNAGGGVSIGHSSALGIGVAIKHNIKIGKHVVVGAKSYVHHDLPDNVIAMGIPCKTTGQRAEGMPYL